MASWRWAEEASSDMVEAGVWAGDKVTGWASRAQNAQAAKRSGVHPLGKDAGVHVKGVVPWGMWPA